MQSKSLEYTINLRFSSSARKDLCIITPFFQGKKKYWMIFGLFFSTFTWVTIAGVVTLEQSSELAEVYYPPSLQL